MFQNKLEDKKLMRMECYINGEWKAADNGGTLEVYNPANGKILGTVPNLGTSETRRAIESADRALSGWRQKTAQERCDLLHNWKDLMLAKKEDLAWLMTAEQGKPLIESRGEINYAASFIDWFAEEGKRVYGDVIPTYQSDKMLLVMKQPVGVCAAITPWNFPSAMITRKAAPALAAGCTMVAKPASATPYSALALAELSRRAGIPPGVFNVVTGSSNIVGEELTSNPLVRKLTFTGSTETGKTLLVKCADTLKKVTMELGGNAPFIVFEDADLDAAVKGAIEAKFRNNGQTCVCTNRFFVQESIYEEFAQKLVNEIVKLKVGNGFEEETCLGPLINNDAVNTVERHIADARSKGAKIILGGSRHSLGGTYFEPTVLTNVTTEMVLANEETFGPVAPLFRFQTEDEAIEIANATQYGLAAYLYTRDLARSWRVSEALEYGMVGLNTGLISTAVAPFGGIKESGIGREGSKYGIEAYLEIKYVCIGEIN